MIFRRGLSGAARNEVAGQINAATRAQYLVIIIPQFRISGNPGNPETTGGCNIT